MKTSSGCIMCFWRQIERTAAMVGLSRRRKVRLYYQLTRKLLKFNFDFPSVIYGRTLYRAIGRAAGSKDIFFAHKLAVEKKLQSAQSRIQRMIAVSRDPLHTAARFSCAANSIDFGAGHTPHVAGLLKELKKTRLKVDHYRYFLRLLAKSRTVLFLGDNCGEAFFDKFFIAAIRRIRPGIKVFYAVRSAPIINDVVMSDAKRAGLDEVAVVLSSGSDSPGLIFSETAGRFRRIYRSADLVISKGQGNFEAFEDRNKEIFYLFKVKCLPVSAYIGEPLNSLLFLHNQHNRYLRKGRRAAGAGL